MSRQHNSRSRRFRFETMETRQMMAGDLSAAVVNGDLLITGGGLSNGVQITAGPTPGTIQVQGLPQAGFDTRVNHQLGPQTFAVQHDVVIDLGGGDNQVQVLGVRVPGNLKISVTDGSDTIAVASAVVARCLNIDTGAGNDTVTVSDDQVHGRLQATLGGGDDYFAMLGSHAYGYFDLDMGRGADRVEVRDSAVDYSMSIRGDALMASQRVTLKNVQVRLDMNVQTCNGKDDVCLTQVSANMINIDTGAGSDRVDLDWVTADHLSISLGDGDDRLSVGNSTARRANLDGGAGANQLVQLHANQFIMLNRDRFSS